LKHTAPLDYGAFYLLLHLFVSGPVLSRGSGWAVAGFFFVFVGLWQVWVPLAEGRNGQTLGKRRCGLRVVSTNGDDLSWIQAVNRRLLGLSTGGARFPGR